jgi:hypothetical protein
MKKILIPLSMLILGIAIGALCVSGAFTSSSNKEISHKTGRAESRYVQTFIKAPLPYPEDNSGLVPGIAEKKTIIKNLFTQAGESAKQFSWFPKIQDEHVFIYVVDLGNARFTLNLGNGQYAIKDGFDESQKPTMVVELTQGGIQNLAEILNDGKLTYEEQYQIYNALAIPTLQALYYNEKLYIPGDKRIFKFDDLVQIDIPPTQPVSYRGFPLHIKLTAANVDGQWLILPGFQGDPDFRLTLTLDQATDLYRMGIYGVRNLQTVSDAITLSNQFLDFLNTTKTYTRTDHQ